MASSKNPKDAPIELAESAKFSEVVHAGEAALAANTDAAVATRAMMADRAEIDAPTPASATVTPKDVSGPGLPSKAYGDFVKEVGLAVAISQKALDENSKDIAESMARTEVPALIALNQVVNEDGEIEPVQPVVQKDQGQLLLRFPGVNENIAVQNLSNLQIRLRPIPKTQQAST